jgi:hypothetical protein
MRVLCVTAEDEGFPMRFAPCLRGRLRGLVLVLLMPVYAGAAELTLMTQPNYTPDQANEVYQPLVDYLARSTGHSFKLITPRNFHFFWRDVRADIAVDLMYAEPHITDYRIQRFGVEPLVRTAEPTVYALLVSDRVENPTLRGLVGRNVVSMPSPSMGFALLAELYPNPLQQPNMQSTAASWRDGVEIIFDESADAAMVPTWLRDAYPNLIPISTSRAFPGSALSARADLDPAIKQSIRDAMLGLHEDSEAFNVLTELNVSRFEPATRAEYAGSRDIMRGLFGYDQ